MANVTRLADLYRRYGLGGSSTSIESSRTAADHVADGSPNAGWHA